jgi:hypothetical protein
MEEGRDWEAKSWNAVQAPCEDATYKDIIENIQAVATAFGIEVDLSKISITPLHFLLNKHLSQDDAVLEQLIARIHTIDTQLTNLHSMMRLEVTDRDKRKIEADSFLDGGFILLWCLYFNKANLLQLFLSEKMIDFWRYTQLKTLLWASLSSKDKELQTGTSCA